MRVINPTDSKSIVPMGYHFPAFPQTSGIAGARYPPQDLGQKHMRYMAFEVVLFTEQATNRLSAYDNVLLDVSLVRDEACKPRYIPYNGYADFKSYGNIISNAKNVLRPASLKDFANENNVAHSKITGTTLYGGSSWLSRISNAAVSQWPSGFLPLTGVQFLGSSGTFLPVGSQIPIWNITYSLTGITPRTSISGTMYGSPYGLASICLSQLGTELAKSHEPEKIGSYYYARSYSNISVSSTSISYDYEVFASPTVPYPVGNEYYHEASNVSFSFEFEPKPPALQWAAGTYNSNSVSLCRIKVTTKNIFRKRRVSGVWVDTTPYVDGTAYYTAANHTMLGNPTPESPPAFNKHAGSIYSSDKIPLDVHYFMDSSINGVPIVRAFELRANDFLKDLRTIAPIPSGEAMQSLTTIIETNHLETLAELRDIASLLDAGKMIRRWGKMISYHQLPSILEFLDDLTSLKLVYTFALNPAYESVVEVTTKAAKLRDRIALTGGLPPSVAHGSTTRTVDLGDPFTSTRFTAKSKIVGTLGPNSVLANMLGVKAAGLFPSLANFWDLVPLSFVLDWFTNLDDRIEELDNQVQALCFDWHYITHSYTLEWEIDTDLLKAYNLQPFSTEKPSLKWYRREKSRFYPSLRDSVFDWNAPPIPQNWGTIGSVFYQLAT